VVVKGEDAMIHLILGVNVVVAALTGIVIYLPVLRELTAGIRGFVLQTHHWGAVSLLVLMLMNIPFFLKETSIQKIKNSQWTALLLFTLVIQLLFTGSLLYLTSKGYVDPSITISQTHIVFGLCLLPLFARHLYLIYWHDIKGQVEDITRRDLLRKAGILFTIVIGWSALDWIKNLQQFSRGEDLKVFEQCNRLSPLPETSIKLPPSTGGYKGRFRVYKIAPIPCATNANWSFTVDGLVEHPLRYDWEDVVKLPRKVQVSDFYCVEGWSVKQVTYEGIPISQLLSSAVVKPEGLFVKFISGDGAYTDMLSLEQALMEDVMCALLIDGNPIPSDLGGPTRLIVPQMFAYKAVKWLTRIELVAEPQLGYWEQRGYQTDAWVGTPPVSK